MRHLPHIFSRMTEICLILAVIFGPMAFGSVEPWAYSILAILAFTALAASLLHDIRTGRAFEVFSPVIIVGLAGMVLLILQLIPWPADLIARIQPASLFPHTLGDEVFDIQSPTHVSLSFYPHATHISFLKLGAYLALFAAAYSYINGRRRLNRITVAVVATGFVAAMFGILQNLVGEGDIFWLRSISRGMPFGPFVSRNQFASYIAITFFTGVGLLLARGGYTPSWFPRKSKQLKLPPSHPWQNLLLGFTVSIMGAAVVWSLSRGGILAFALSGAATVVAMAIGGHSKGKRIYLAAVILTVLGFLTWLGWEPVLDRLQTLGIIVSEPASIDEARYTMWGDAWDMGLTYPLFGTGAGSFLSSYPAFSSLPFRSAPRNPHSEYMGFLAETGFIGLGLILLASTLILKRIFRALRLRHNPYILPFLAGGVGVVFSIAIHSVVDFPLRSPGIVATLAIVLAVVYRIAILSSKQIPGSLSGSNAKDQAKKQEPEKPRPYNSSVERGKSGLIVNSLLAGAVFLGWLFACSVALGELNGQIEQNRITRATKQLTPETRNVADFVDASRLAIQSFSPRNASLYDHLAEFTRQAADTVEDPRNRIILAEKALDIQEIAATLEPVNADHRVNLAIDYLALGRPDIAWMHSKLASELLSNDPWVRIDLAEMFFSADLEEPGTEMLDEAEMLAKRRGLDSVLRRIERLRPSD